MSRGDLSILDLDSCILLVNLRYTFGSTAYPLVKHKLNLIAFHLIILDILFRNCTAMSLHLSLELLVESLELVHVRGLGRPANTETLCLVGLRDLLRWLVCLCGFGIRREKV